MILVGERVRKVGWPRGQKHGKSDYTSQKMANASDAAQVRGCRCMLWPGKATEPTISPKVGFGLKHGLRDPSKADGTCQCASLFCWPIGVMCHVEQGLS